MGSTLQDYFKIKPDISTFGKCFGGGLPLGIISVSKEIYKKMSKNQRKVFLVGLSQVIHCLATWA